MLTIHITEFYHYSYEELFEFLTTRHEVHYRIYLPKHFVAPNNKEEVFWDYYVALYSGELLSKLSQSFTYYTPSPFTNDNFYFEIICTDTRNMAYCIYHILCGYRKEREANFSLFHEKASDFLIDVYNKKVNPKCAEFLPLIQEYIGYER